MSGKEREWIDMTVPEGEIRLRIMVLREEGGARAAKAVQRLGFVSLRYQGFSVTDAAGIMRVSIQTGYNWQRAWNESGIGSVLPNYSGGRPSALDDTKKAELREAVRSARMTTAEARAHIQAAYGIGYSSKQVHVILSSLGLRHISSKKLDPVRGQSPGNGGRMRWIRSFRQLSKQFGKDEACEK